jgi:hypothetical protein
MRTSRRGLLNLPGAGSRALCGTEHAPRSPPEAFYFLFSAEPRQVK